MCVLSLFGGLLGASAHFNNGSRASDSVSKPGVVEGCFR